MAKGIGNGFPLAAVVTTPGKTAPSLLEAVSQLFANTLVVYHLPKNCCNFGQNVSIVRQFLLDRLKHFRNKRNLLKGSPKFPPEIFKWKVR